MQDTTRTEANRPVVSRGTSVLAGLLTGAAVGLIGAVASAPLRRLANVSDRALVNGASVVIGAIVLWALLGVLYAALRNNPQSARRAVLGSASSVAVAGTIVIYTALSGFALRLPSLAEPLLLLVALGGAALFLALVARPLSIPLRFVAPGGLIAAVAAGVLVAALDRTPSVHYTLSKLPATTRLAASETTQPATAATTQSSSGVSGASQPAGTATSAQPSGAAAASTSGQPAPAGILHFTVASGSEAAYTVHEKLTRLPSPSDAIGKTQTIKGDIYVDAAKGIATTNASVITVDLRTLTTDSPMRDNFIKMDTLQTSRFPSATFTVTSIDGFPTTYKEGDEAKVTVNGTMNVHGIDKPVAWTGTARYAGGQLEAVLSTDVTMTMFGMTPPQVPTVQSVDDKVHLDLHLVTQKAA